MTESRRRSKSTSDHGGWNGCASTVMYIGAGLGAVAGGITGYEATGILGMVIRAVLGGIVGGLLGIGAIVILPGVVFLGMVLLALGVLALVGYLMYKGGGF